MLRMPCDYLAHGPANSTCAFAIDVNHAEFL